MAQHTTVTVKTLRTKDRERAKRFALRGQERCDHEHGPECCSHAHARRGGRSCCGHVHTRDACGPHECDHRACRHRCKVGPERCKHRHSVSCCRACWDQVCGIWSTCPHLCSPDCCNHVHGICCRHRFECEVCSNYGQDRDAAGYSLKPEPDRLIQGYSYKPVPKFYGKGEVYFGIELEIEAAKGKDPNLLAKEVLEAGKGFWYCKYDASLVNGVELVSHPATIEVWRGKELEGLFGKLRQMGARSWDTGTCGMHVHVNKTALSRLQQAMLQILLEAQPQMTEKLARRAYNQYFSLQKDGKKIAFAKGLGLPHERHNLLNLNPPYTAEFRLFKGTLNAESFKRNVELVNGLVHFVRESPVDATANLSKFLVWVQTGTAKRLIGKEGQKALVPWLTAVVLGDRED